MVYVFGVVQEYGLFEPKLPGTSKREGKVRRSDVQFLCGES